MHIMIYFNARKFLTLKFPKFFLQKFHFYNFTVLPSISCNMNYAKRTVLLPNIARLPLLMAIECQEFIFWIGMV